MRLKKRQTILFRFDKKKAVRLFLSTVFLCGSAVFAADVERSISSMTPAQAEKQIKELKSSLSSAKTDRRGRIIKRIAELENKALEQRIKSSDNRR